MPVEVVDGDERQAARPRESLRGRQADEERTDQSRALGDGDTIDVLEARVRLRECLADYRRDQLEMAARRDLGHDAAVGRVQLRLRGDDAGADLAVAGDERRRGLVATRLDAEDQTGNRYRHKSVTHRARRRGPST